MMTEHLFNIDNKLMLFDLTNFYFEGSKRNSQKSKFGRSKEKTLRLQAPCLGALHQQGGLHTLLFDPRGQYGRPEVFARYD